MREFTEKEWKAFNADQRELQACFSIVLGDTTYEFTGDDQVISFDVTTRLTDTINTPFDLACSDSCSVVLYNSYTGEYNGQQVEDFRIFDPLKNPDVKRDSKMQLTLRALCEDGEWTRWVPIGIFYLTDVKINDDRLTANIQGDDLLSIVFSKDIPRQPVYRDKTFQWFIDDFCAKYNLTTNWLYSIPDKLRFAYIQDTVKRTIQELIRSAACVAHIHITDDLQEELRIIPFKYFSLAATVPVIDYSNYEDENKAQFITLQYNKSILSYADKTRVTWHRTSVSDIASMYSYNTTDMEDFHYSAASDYYTYGLSKAGISPTPMHCIDYYSVVAPYKPGDTGLYHTLLTQYSLTADVRLGFELDQKDADEYNVTAYGRYINAESQQEPAIAPKTAVDLLEDYTKIDLVNEYLDVDLPYVQYPNLAKDRHYALSVFATCDLQTVDIQLRCNPFIELTDGIAIEAEVYDIQNFAGILWEQTISYNGGGLSSQAVLVNKDAFTMGIDIYDVAAYQGEKKTTVTKFYIVGKSNNYHGLWFVDEAYSGSPGYYSLLGKLTGDITDMAVTFDGVWQLSSNFSYYTLITEEVPWVFYIQENILYAKHGIDGTAVQLADNVKYVAAERGYYPRDYGDINTDQGVIAAYITTDNKAYYRAYAATSLAGDKAWFDAEPIQLPTTAAIVDIQVHRLNDYRIGICITTEEYNYWLISARQYSQMAFRPERVSLPTSNLRERLPFSLRFDNINELPQPTWTWSVNKERTQITLHSSMWLEYFSRIADCFILPNGLPKYTVHQVDHRNIQIHFQTAIMLPTATISFKVCDFEFAGDTSTDEVLTECYGWVIINADISHLFDFRDNINGYNFETVTLPITVPTIDIQLQVEQTYNAIHTEYIALSPVVLRDFNPAIHLLGNKIVTSTEHITMPIATLTGITVGIQSVNFSPV